MKSVVITLTLLWSFQVSAFELVESINANNRCAALLKIGAEVLAGSVAREVKSHDINPLLEDKFNLKVLQIGSYMVMSEMFSKANNSLFTKLADKVSAGQAGNEGALEYRGKLETTYRHLNEQALQGSSQAKTQLDKLYKQCLKDNWDDRM